MNIEYSTRLKKKKATVHDLYNNSTDEKTCTLLITTYQNQPKLNKLTFNSKSLWVCRRHHLNSLFFTLHLCAAYHFHPGWTDHLLWLTKQWHFPYSCFQHIQKFTSELTSERLTCSSFWVGKAATGTSASVVSTDIKSHRMRQPDRLLTCFSCLFTAIQMLACYTKTMQPNTSWLKPVFWHLFPLDKMKLLPQA